MASKKRANVAQENKSDKIIQYSALGVILIIVATFAWNYTPRKQATVPGGQDPACAIFDSIPAADKYQSAPPLLIDTTKKYFATITLEKGGDIQMQLYPDKAPNTVNSFIFLACKGFYNGVTFHRVLKDFMAQTGDPTGTGAGGPGYQFNDEGSDLKFDKEGVVAMANTGPNTNGSQFFITFGPQDYLNGGYTIFGQVVSGMDVAKAITLRNPDENPPFQGDKIVKITITQE